MRPLKVVAVSSLFPNLAQPNHGIFLEHRLKHLAECVGVEVQVVAPVPWFPIKNKNLGRYSNYARAPRWEQRSGLSVFHPRFIAIPKVSPNAAGLLMALTVAPVLAKLIKDGFRPDVIDGYYLYPDGVACALLSKWFNVPFVLTAFGSDISLIPRAKIPRAQILWATRRAQGLTAVCDALRLQMQQLGVERDRIHVIKHGVDLSLFDVPPDRNKVRRRLGLQGVTLLSAGSLIQRKGHHIAISALVKLPGAQLLIAGSGPLNRSLRAQARSLSLADRVTFLGELSQRQLAEVMGAVDVLVLCSDREGIANVLLEAMACGTPAVATCIWGTPELMNVASAGVLIQDRTPQALADGVQGLLAAYPARATIRKHASCFSWTDTAAQHVSVLQDAILNY